MKKIVDLPEGTCRHPEHNPPMHTVLEDGVWEHTCPGCGHRQTFVVRRPTWLAHEESLWRESA